MFSEGVLLKDKNSILPPNGISRRDLAIAKPKKKRKKLGG
jgi:hypothetical protein